MTDSPHRRRLLVLLLIIAAAARLPRVLESLWYDEIAALLDYVVHGPRFIVTTWYDPANHVLQSLLSWTAMSALDGVIDPAILLRLPSLLFSVATVPLVYGLAARAATPRVATLAAFFYAVCPVAILAGAEARGYSAMIFFAAAMTWQMQILLDRLRPRGAVVYALLAGLGAWAHLITVFVPIGHAAYLLWQFARTGNPRDLRRGGPGLLGGALVALALYAQILGQMIEHRAIFASADGPALFGAEGLHSVLQIGGAWYAWAAAPGIALAIIGLATSIRHERARRTAALTLMGGPIMAAVIIAAGSWTYARFMLFMLPGAVLLIALGADALLHRRRALGVAATLLLLAPWCADLLVRPPKQPLRDAARWVDTRREAGESILVIGLRANVLRYYALELDWDQLLFSPELGRDLSAHLRGEPPSWIIMLYEESVPRDRREALERAGYAEVARFEGWVDWTNGAVIILRARP